MTMSRDRVHFKLDTFHLDAATIKAFEKAFGTPCGTSIGLATIVCRPSQFARFLIYRNDFGGQNQFKALEPRLVKTEDTSVIDVSRKSTCAE